MGYSRTLAVGDNFEFGGPISFGPNISNIQADKNLGTITLPSIPGGKLKYVYLDIQFRGLTDYGGSYTTGAQNIICENGGGDVTAIALPTESFSTVSTGGMRVVGCLDCKAAFSLGGTTTVRWRNSLTFGVGSIQFRDWQNIARVVLEG